MEEVTGWIHPDGRPDKTGKRCRFFVYDSEESTYVGKLWRVAVTAETAVRSRAYRIPSGKDIEEILKAMLDTYRMQNCGCVSEIQFWSHGSPGNGMYITGDGEFTVKSFDIPGLRVFGEGPLSAGVRGFRECDGNLSEQKRLLVVLRRTVCDPDSEGGRTYCAP